MAKDAAKATAPSPTPAAATAGGKGTQAVLRALSLLSFVGRGGGAGLGLGELAAASGLSRPTTRRLLLALVTARMVEQDPLTRRYRLGAEAFLLASFASDRHGILAHAEDSLRRLAADSGDTAFLTVQQDDHAICLHHEEGDFPIRTHALKTGDRNPMGVGVGALAILAALPEAEGDTLMDRLAPLHGGLHAALRADLTLARARGFALNPGRVVAGSWGLGMVVRWPDGRPAAGLSIAAIESRMKPARQDELVALLKREAARVEARLARLSTPETAIDTITDTTTETPARTRT